MPIYALVGIYATTYNSFDLFKALALGSNLNLSL